MSESKRRLPQQRRRRARHAGTKTKRVSKSRQQGAHRKKR